MATNKSTELRTTVLSSAEFAAAGLPLDISANAVKIANDANTSNGAACVNGDPLISVAVASIRNDLRAAEMGTIKAAIGLALLEEHNAWANITAPDGKPFRNVQAFRRVVFAGYDESNVRKYSDAGRRVYLAALRGELNDIPLNVIQIKDGNIIAAMPMRTATALKAALTDERTRKALPAAIKDANPSKDGRISFKAMSDAVKRAKDVSGQKPADADTPIASAADVDAAVISADIKRTFRAYMGEDELHIGIDVDELKRVKSLLALASKNADNALLFVKELSAIIDNAR